MRKIFILMAISLLIFIGCKKNQEEIIKIPLVTWGGYAALFAVNNGAFPNEESLFYKYGKFKVELVQEENPANQLQGFANGTYPIIWSTMDMLPLHYESLSKDSRTVPKVIGIFDYSNGGDGIIVRGDIKSGKDLKGKKIVTSQYTPSHFFILWFLNENGLTSKDVTLIYAADAIAAKDSYVNDKSIDACVTWSPFIYDITDPTKESYVSGSKLLITSKEGNPAYGLIADIYLARADFVKNNPEKIQVFVKAMIEGYDIFLKDKEKVAQDIANLFGIKGGKDEVMLMFEDVTIAGKEENRMFFDKNSKFSAYNIFRLSESLYKKNDSIISNINVNPEEVIESSFMLNEISK